MKTILLIILIGFTLLLSMQPVNAEPVPEPVPDCDKGLILTNDGCISPDGPICGPGTTYQDGICIANDTEKDSQIEKWENPYENTEFEVTAFPCGTDAVLVDGICHVIETDSEYWPAYSFVSAFFFIVFTLPFSIPAALIFIVLSKTPRYSREIRIAVCIAASLVLLYFSWALSVGVYPPGYA